MKFAARSAALVFALVITCAPALGQSCPPQGDSPKASIQALDRLKNRNAEPTNYARMTVPDFLAKFPASSAGNMDEAQGIVLEGYIVAAKQSGPESSNCHSQTARDFHVWVGAAPATSPQDGQAKRADAVIVEPTPWSQKHTGIRLRTLIALAKQGAKVRIYGWLFLDPEHLPELSKTRGTLWEVHPVTKIEVFTSGQWVEARS